MAGRAVEFYCHQKEEEIKRLRRENQDLKDDSHRKIQLANDRIQAMENEKKGLKRQFNEERETWHRQKDEFVRQKEEVTRYELLAGPKTCNWQA